MDSHQDDNLARSATASGGRVARVDAPNGAQVSASPSPKKGAFKALAARVAPGRAADRQDGRRDTETARRLREAACSGEDCMVEVLRGLDQSGREALVHDGAALGRELFKKAEKQDWPRAHLELRTVFAYEAEYPQSEARSRLAKAVLKAHDIDFVSEQALRKRKLRLAAERVEGRWITLSEFIDRIRPSADEAIRLARETGLDVSVLWAHYPSTKLARALVEDGRLDLPPKRWFDPARPIPAAHIQSIARTFKNYPELIEKLSLPTDLGPAAARAYASRVAAAWVLERTHEPRPAPRATREPPPASCSVCFEPYDAALPSKRPVGLRGCAHPPLLDLECFKGMIAARDDKCPCCRTPISPEDIISHGVDLAVDPAPSTSSSTPLTLADALAFRIAIQHANAIPGWRTCSEERCVGGMMMPEEAKAAPFTCRLCRVENVLQDTSGAGYVIPLINGIVPGNPPTALNALNDPVADAIKPIRECYHCGLATERSMHCDRMVCGQHRHLAFHEHKSGMGCGLAWNFNRGMSSPWTAGDETLFQSYVPKKSLLVDAGFYEGLAPGANYDPKDIMRTLLRNAWKKGVVPDGKLPETWQKEEGLDLRDGSHEFRSAFV